MTHSFIHPRPRLLPMLIATLLAASGHSMAAEQVDLEALQAAPGLAKAASLQQLTGLASDELKTVRSMQFEGGRSSTRFQQHYRGVPIWGSPINERHDGKGGVSWHGPLLRNLAQDLPSVVPLLSRADALQTAKTLAQARTSENEQVQLYIRQDEQGVARLFYLVSFFDAGVSRPSRPFFMLDANSGAVLQRWNGINHAVGEGPGGNPKIGLYEYKVGGPRGALDVTANGSTCTLDNASVMTIDMKNQTTGGTVPHAFTCPRNTVRPTNGAPSPMNDAHAMGSAMVNMYKSWLGVSPLRQKLVMRVHYGSNYANAYWNGSAMVFGDGDLNTYPATIPDVIGHEVGHGFTEQHSGLVYTGQAGGINEAFSDMSGEALEYYFFGSNNFLIGDTLFKTGTTPLRSMINPTSDGRSIDHLSKYVTGMDVHYSSGIFNKAFYLLATKTGWNTRKAFEVMAIANQLYWSTSSSFVDAACNGVMRATRDKGYNTADVESAFGAVGINCTIDPPPVPYLTKAVPVTGITLPKGGSRVFSFIVPAGKTKLTVKLSGGTGDGDLYMKLGATPTTTSYGWRANAAGNNDTISVNAPAAGTYQILLYAYAAVSGASLVADYN